VWECYPPTCFGGNEKQPCPMGTRAGGAESTCTGAHAMLSPVCAAVSHTHLDSAVMTARPLGGVGVRQSYDTNAVKPRCYVIRTASPPSILSIAAISHGQVNACWQTMLSFIVLGEHNSALIESGSIN
jgi:hypothetical protein